MKVQGLITCRVSKACLVSCLCFGWMVLAACSTSQAQSSNNADIRETQNQINEHLEAGEFPLAIGLANTLSKPAADVALAQVVERQMAAGSQAAAFDTAGLIADDRNRANVLSGLGGGVNNGRAGGITLQDFQPLIDLIQNTVANDSWLDTGTGLGTIQAYPAGVFVDGSGTLKRLKVDAAKFNSGVRDRAFSDSGNRQPQLPSDMRMVSLTRLEKEAQLLAAQGLGTDMTMQNLAGLTEVKYVMAFPETGDIIVAGPAGPWKKDANGRSVNIESGKPVLQLDDLVVCLRNAWGNNGKFGCAITPRQENLAATQEFLAKSKLRGNAWTKKLREVLGKQDIEVFGIDARTHAARILVEADYRMKLIGMGLEPTIPEVPSYLERIQLNPDGSVPPMDVVRWWFTLNYDDVFSDASKLAFTFTGTGVKVLSENELLDDQGRRIHTGQSHGPTKAFARDFTRHFNEMADQYPIYRELKNVFDMALVASLIRHQDLAEKVNWHLTFFGPENSSGSLRYHVTRGAVANQVDSVMNKKVLTFRKRSSTLKHTIVGVSGGISYDAHEAISADRIKLADDQISDEVESSRPEIDQRNWWWD